jgi:hypothetical protein
MLDFLFDLLEGLQLISPRYMRKRERRQAWSGTVEAKRTWTLSKHAYLVIFRTDDGQRKKVRLDRKEDFDLYEEGRRYTKRAGDDMPDVTPAS